MILEDILIKLKTGKQDKAYTFQGESYTYEELYKYVCNIYKFLLLNNNSKRPVIIYGNKEIYMKASFLACSYAGITYIPIDCSMPADRIISIINQINPYCVIGNFKNTKCNNISKEQIYGIMNNSKFDDINEIFLKPEDIYYIIFTSGSTGIPKGVKVTYNNLDSCVKWLQCITNIEKGVVLNQAIFSFDLSIADLYLSLISGSEHFILESNKLNFSNIFKDLKTSNSTIAVMTPSFADLLLLDRSFRKDLLPQLKTILFCGEKLLKSTVQKLYERFDDIEIINSYGPSECTFAVTSIKISKDMLNMGNLPIRPAKKRCKNIYPR